MTEEKIVSFADRLNSIKEEAVYEVSELESRLKTYEYTYGIEFDEVQSRYYRCAIRDALYELVIRPWLVQRKKEVAQHNFGALADGIEKALKDESIPVSDEIAKNVGSIDLEAFGYVFKLVCTTDSRNQPELCIEQVFKVGESVN